MNFPGMLNGMLNRDDTIFALSSGRPPAAIAVVRVSGPGAGDAIMALARRMPQPRQATLVRLMSRGPIRDVGGIGPHSVPEPIDDALVLWFPGPRSETGEDTVEFHLHGGPAVVAAVLAELDGVKGLRPAGPGEFTRRAFENGKLDLTRVEGLADLIGAETEAQRRQAFRQLKGLLGDRAQHWRERLTEALALVEASIDFPDEDVVSERVIQPALAIAKEVEGEIRKLLADSHRGERLREGLTVAVAGPVNVGKSSIVNRLAKRPAAIVSPHAGTTRDVIEVHLDLGGFPVTILDTAGMRHTGDPVEEEGVRRARVSAEASDLVLWVSDATQETLPPPADLAKQDGPPVWLLRNKSDLVEGNGGKKADEASLRHAGRYGSTKCYCVSARTGASFDELVGGITEYAKHFFSVGVESALVTRQRQRTALKECADALGRACAEEGSLREDIIAEELRLATRALGRLVGRVDVENVLDVIFRDFCIGK
jgi:tRNA modification GTPase